jgi:hypothetical protein
MAPRDLITPDDLDAAARTWLVQSRLHPHAAAVDTCRDLSLATGIPEDVIRASMASITARACVLRAEIAKQRKKVAGRIAAAKKGARTREAMREARRG